MIGVAAIWIVVLLGVGGYALDRSSPPAITDNFDAQLDYVLTALIASSEIGPDGEVILNRPPADQRFLEPIRGSTSRSAAATSAEPSPRARLWDRAEVGPHRDYDIHVYDSGKFPRRDAADCRARREAARLAVRWRFQVAQNRDGLDEQIKVLRRTWSAPSARSGSASSSSPRFRPSTACGRCAGCAGDRSIRSGEKGADRRALPREIEPLTEELNALLVHNEVQAEEARRHAGNLAHALKTPLTVITNAATATAPTLPTPSAARRDHAPPGRPSPRPRPRDRPPRLGPGARRGLAVAGSGRARRVQDLRDVTIDLDGDRKAPRSGSRSRIWTRCSATSSRMPPNMAAAASS
jgi:signal transduction histidine kinase